MDGFIHLLDEIIASGAEIGKLLLEGVGVVVLIGSGIQSIVGYFRKSVKQPALKLAKGTSSALTFMLGGEVLGTIIATSWENLLMLGAIVILRVAINFVLLWEINHEEKELTENNLLNKVQSIGKKQ
ncbi:MAG: DUF1622 domain-containing protein [Clostridiales bacterium]|nr:DUF1622 domain-containing protein [Clostridiales bacterium]